MHREVKEEQMKSVKQQHCKVDDTKHVEGTLSVWEKTFQSIEGWWRFFCQMAFSVRWILCPATFIISEAATQL